MPFASIPEAIEDFRAGRMLIVVDDEDRENEGDLTLAAEFVTPEAINFMAVHGRGLICLALAPERCDALHLPLVSPMNTSRFGTAFCESIDAARRRHHRHLRRRPRPHHSHRHRPGMPSARSRPPGPRLPSARPRGRRAGPRRPNRSRRRSRAPGRLEPGGVICEIMNEDGTMARVPQLTRLLRAARAQDDLRRQPHPLPPRTERFLERRGEGCLRTEFGDFKTITFVSIIDGEQHIALVRGEVAGQENVLVRMHARCVAGDVFGSTECDCHAALQTSLGTDRRGRQGRAGLPPRNRTRRAQARTRTARPGQSMRAASARRSSPTSGLRRFAC